MTLDALKAAHPMAMARFGAALGESARPGDALLLSGDLGAGKTTLARAFIRAAAARPDLDAASPSFALILSYETPRGPLRHADLYRLSGPDELEELGLTDWSGAISLVEWPDRLGLRRPAGALEIHIETPPEGGRLLRFKAEGPRAAEWLAAARRAVAAPPDRSAARSALLMEAGWRQAAAKPLAGDASARRYERLCAPDGSTAILMDCDPASGLSITPFGAVNDWLRGRGFHAPEIYAADPQAGWMLLEDLGDNLLARAAADRLHEADHYARAVDALAMLQAEPIPTALPYLGALHHPPLYDDAIIRRETLLLFDVWATAAGRPLSPEARDEGLALFFEALAPHRGETGFVYVDYHAENLVILPDGLGLLDHQDARRGHGAYDLVSLLEDARRDVPRDLAAAMTARFAARAGHDLEALRGACAAWGAQRNAKILGLFARLALEKGKPRYLALIPRVWDHFQHDLTHPALARLAAFAARHILAPTPELLNRLTERAAL